MSRRAGDSRTVLVLGSGPAGLSAALAARRAGARVTVVERGFAGGNAVAHSLLPSKVHLAAAATLAAYGAWGFGPPPSGALWAVGGHLRWRREAARAACEELVDRAGAERLAGALRFIGPGAARLAAPSGAVDLAFDAAVVATGSVQTVPDGLVPDGRRVVLPRDLAGLTEAPARAVVLGGGATGVEIACLLRAYGTDVTLIGRRPRLLPGEDPALAEALAGRLGADGIHLRLGEAAVAFTPAADGVVVGLAGGDELGPAPLFVATGRRGATGDLGLEALDLRADPNGYLAVDGHGFTGRPGLFAAGDVTGAPLVANKADGQGAAAGRAAARAAAGEAPDGAGVDPALVPVAVFSRPEYARVGEVPNEAASPGRVVVAADDALGLRRHVFALDGPERLRLSVDRASGAVRGAALLGEGAAERILLFAAAVAWGVRLDRLAALLPVVPAAGGEVRALFPPDGRNPIGRS